jgi:hypothetical protein
VLGFDFPNDAAPLGSIKTSQIIRMAMKANNA